MMTQGARAAVVLGADSVLGQTVVRTLMDDGFHVYAAGHSPNYLGVLRRMGATPVQLDPACDSDVFGLSRLLGMLHPAVEVLVHCAAADVDIRAAIDVHPHERGSVASRGGLACERHFLGLTQLVQLLLPAMRAQGRGRIVQVSGAMRAGTTPQSAWVTASQSALTVWLACLRMELLPFGVHVVQIGVPPPGRFPYRRAFGENPGMGLTMVAQLLRQAVRSRSPAAHLTPGWQHRAGQLIQQTLGTRAALWCRARWPVKQAGQVDVDEARPHRKPLPDEVDVHDLFH
ncbi:MAG: hypothetical protein CFE46_09980 [Burkholderiales bacterium PBB6]|nr:MAG: hypothetical protein CFE46_09980 [Burkholderiales bacterium PBB6]